MSKLEVDKIDPQSGTDLELGTSGDTITIPTGVTLDASNATTTLPANVVTTDGSQTLTNKSIDASQLTGTITPSDNTVSLAKLTATGTKDATTFLRGDNTFAGGGKVLQVVQTVKTDIFTRSSSASFADITDVSVSITPSSTSSKILLTFDADVGSSRTDGSPTFVYFKLTKAVGGGSASDVTGALGDSRGSSIRAWCNAGSRFGGASDITAEHTHAQYLDSPSTTSALVYQVQVRSTDGTATIGGSESTSDSNRVSTPTVLTAMEIGA
jgi:hypothetical protein